MRFIIVIAFLVTQIVGFAQFTVIPTSTSSSITEIRKEGNFVLINGVDGYLSKCYDDCNDLINLSVVGDFDYQRDNLNLIDTSTFYIASHTDFPHHGYIFKSIDGGYSWEEVLDTNGILFSSFLMFDTTNGVLISSLYNAMITEDGGNSWEHESHGLPIVSSSLKINDSTAIMGVTEEFRYTTDRGNSWSGTSFVQSSPTDFYATTIDSIFAVTYGVTGEFFSYNFALGESAWQNKSIENFVPHGLCVKSIEEVYIVGRIASSGTCGIIKTTDLGDNWGVFDTGISGALNEMIFLNDSIALIGGTDGLLIKWDKNSTFDFSSIENRGDKKSISIFPNPANNLQYLKMTLTKPSYVYVDIVNVDGVIVMPVFNGESSTLDKFVKVDLASLPKGIYFYSVRVDDANFQKKIIKL